VTLLLCGHFASSDSKPLEPREYHRLVNWLVQHDLHIADLAGVLSFWCGPVAHERLSALLQRDEDLKRAADVWTERAIWVISQTDDEYPRRFQSVDAPAPPLLYGVGPVEALNDPGLAIGVVGSRHIDERVTEFAARIGRGAARLGVRIVSGGARGADSAAALPALEDGGAATLVLANGLSRAAKAHVYRPFFSESQLTLVSPYDPGAGFSAGNAMGRNKWIYTLSDASIVVSSADGTGGTWAGAIEAVKHRCRVFVRADDDAPAGNRALISQGARILPDDALDDLQGWLHDVREGDKPGNDPAPLQQARLL